MEKENKSGLIYSSALEGLTNRYWQLQRLQEEGHNVNPLIEETWENIQTIIDNEKLQTLRGELDQCMKE